MKLPDSWIEAPLSEIAEIVGGGTPDRNNPSYFGGGIPWVTPSDVSNLEGIYLKKTQETISEEGLKKSATTLVQEDSVLLATRVAVGKAAIAIRPTAINQDFAGLMLDKNIINAEYLVRFFRSIEEYFNSRSQGSTIQGITRDTVKRTKILLPTLPEQLRIVEILQQIDAICNSRKRVSNIASQIAREHFLELFGHPAENPHGFEIKKFSKLGIIERGVSKHRPRDAEHLLGGPYPFIQTGDVTNAGDWITDFKNTYSEAGLAQSRLWPKGTLCITIAANIARASILDFDACFPDSVVGFTSSEGIYSEYVLYCIRFYQEFFEARAPKSAQMNINLEILKRLRIPNPPSRLQKQFAEFVHAVRQIESSIKGQLSKQTALNNAIQLSAFSGELTDNWRQNNEKTIKKAIKARDAALSTTKQRKFRTTIEIVTETNEAELLIEEKKIRRSRHTLLKELSNFQKAVRNALQKLNRILIPDDSASLDRFCNELSAQNETNLQDRVLRALDQLAALGLIAKVSLPNEQGHYLNGFRMLREGESRRVADIQTVTDAMKRFEKQKAAG